MHFNEDICQKYLLEYIWIYKQHCSTLLQDNPTHLSSSPVACLVKRWFAKSAVRIQILLEENPVLP